MHGLDDLVKYFGPRHGCVNNISMLAPQQIPQVFNQTLLFPTCQELQQALTQIGVSEKHVVCFRKPRTGTGLQLTTASWI